MRLLSSSLLAGMMACAQPADVAPDAAPGHEARTTQAAHAIVAISADGVELLDLFWADSVPAPTQGEPVDHVEVLDDAGAVLARIPVPDTRLISVIAPEGDHGDVITLDRSVVRVPFAWPDGAVTARVGASEQSPREQLRPIGGPLATQVLGSGDPAERLDLVFLGDGYRITEEATFEADVDRMVAHLLTIEPYASYGELFNAWRYFVPSAESGADNSGATPPVFVDTTYDCYYNCGGTDRLLCCNSGALIADASLAVPGYDGLVVLVNSNKYGGAGSSAYASTYTIGGSSEEVMAHEMGHSLLGLMDEYNYGGTTTSSGGVNCDADPGVGRWSHWVGSLGVGAFTPCSYDNLHRPTQNACMMNSLQNAYCPVCREHAVREIYERLPAILTSTTPSEGPVTLTGPTTFSATTPLGALGQGPWLASWKLDGVEVGTGPSYTVGACPGGTTLTLDVRDPTNFVRYDPQDLLLDQASWTLQTTCDGDGDGYTSAQGDCNDGDATIHPGRIEALDGVDSNCDGADGLQLTLDTVLNAGGPTTFTITGAKPNRRVYLLASLAGTGTGVCPPQLGGDCMDVLQPAYFSGVTNSIGRVDITVTVPSGIGGRLAWFQAAQLAPPAQKSPVRARFVGN